MKLKQKIGVVGNGFVGSAVQFGFSPTTGCDSEVRVYDKDPSKSVDSIEETVNESEFVFLSVPTPSNKDGSMNLDIVEQALVDMSEVNENKHNIVLLRSTVVPGTTRELQSKFDNLRLVFNPEFLTERNAKYDFINVGYNAIKQYQGTKPTVVSEAPQQPANELEKKGQEAIQRLQKRRGTQRKVLDAVKREQQNNRR